MALVDRARRGAPDLRPAPGWPRSAKASARASVPWKRAWTVSRLWATRRRAGA